MNVLSSQFQMNKKETNIRKAFEKIFCLCPNSSNDDIISTLRPGLKMGVENDIFWSEIVSGFGEAGGTPPPRIHRSTPRGCFQCCSTDSGELPSKLTPYNTTLW